MTDPEPDHRWSQFGQIVMSKIQRKRCEPGEFACVVLDGVYGGGFPNEIQTWAIDSRFGFIRIPEPGPSGSAKAWSRDSGFLFPRRQFLPGPMWLLLLRKSIFDNSVVDFF